MGPALGPGQRNRRVTKPTMEETLRAALPGLTRAERHLATHMLMH
ncbi:MAG: RpiR family transcriptional regulator, partial [Rhodobacteraceae bacterium]|nr:RpiR family transcriptional regulator [Paracoccaceae bacterium]